MIRVLPRSFTGIILPLLPALLPYGLAAQQLTPGEAARAALSRHPASASAAARVDEAAETLQMARADRLPGVRLEGQLTRFQEPMIVAPLHAFDPASPPTFDETLVQGRVNVTYTLFDGGDRGARIDGADASMQAVLHGRAAVDSDLLARVAGAYLVLGAARAVREAAQAQTLALSEEVDRAERRFDAGTAPRVEVLRAGAALQDARAQSAAADARLDLATRDLARLMGTDPERLRRLALVEATWSDAEQAREATSPELRRAAAAVDAAEAGVAMEGAGRWPRLEAQAGLQQFGTLTREQVFEWQAGIRVSWPIFTGGARSASLGAARARLRRVRAERDEVALELERAIDAASAAIVEAEARAEALEASVEQWAEVARIEALALEAGSGLQADLLGAQARLFQARAGLARAQADAATARVSLARARGTLDVEWLNRVVEVDR